MLIVFAFILYGVGIWTMQWYVMPLENLHFVGFDIVVLDKRDSASYELNGKGSFNTRM